ncbi:hypothetical protein [Nocardia inohanensis]|uniref:hypothetical protein n=1 Tax=Nocardia inohanensis TaxID=209246 RepID=UPI00083535D4|nr:hypothetical protein [Nocardia inohanensis]
MRLPDTAFRAHAGAAVTTRGGMWKAGGGQDRTSRLRGGSAGALTAALAIAAHAAAGGPTPGSTGVTLLLLAAAAIGAVAMTLPRSASRTALPALMAAAQPLCHVALTGLSHGGHGSAAGGFSGFLSGSAAIVSDAAMAAGHAAAAVVCALLIAAADRLYGLVAQAVRVAVNRPGALAAGPRPRTWTSPRSTLRSLRIAGAAGPRAPPVAA